ncbi:MAG: hypothetical protein QW625_02910 [Candidatus Nanoarchaeia archaeon]
MVSNKSPWLAAFLNFVFWGSGYVYIKHRMVLGIGLMLITIFNLLILLTIPYIILLSNTELFFVWLSFLWFAMSLLFAFDVYKEAKELNKI